MSFRKLKEERKLNTKEVILTDEQATEWKKNSIPFPNVKTNSNDELVQTK